MDSFKEVYSDKQKEKISSEFSRLKGHCYLEHTGATLYSDKQMSNVLDDLTNNLYGNPHAFNISSQFTGDIVDQIRLQILEHFNTDSEAYSVIFTSGATAALKIVAETFNYEGNKTLQSGTIRYLEDNHTSVLGMREYAKEYKILTHDAAFEIFNKDFNKTEWNTNKSNSLFVYPAQCNFSGTKYPLTWIKKVQNGILNQLETVDSNWFCLLDAASFVSNNHLDLWLHNPDFVALSFYKIFGYPTGLGALLVKNSSSYILKKKYFGGGTVQMTLPNEHVFRTNLHERFEDGTVSFLSIISLRHGFETLKRLNLTMELISNHTFSLTQYVHNNLLDMHHFNESPVAVLYHDTDFQNKEHQGAIINFNLLRDNGEFIGYSEVLHIATLYNVHFRTGCFCNPGACQRHLNLSPDIVKHHFKSGHVCGDQNDIIDGYPTGSIRISFGYMSTKEDADKFLKMVKDFFITKPLIRITPKRQMFQEIYKLKFSEKEYFNKLILKTDSNDLAKKHSTKEICDNIINQNTQVCGIVKNIYLYPVKSCAKFSVTDEWVIDKTGLKYDREWMIVTGAGVCLTQKQERHLCLIKPNVDLIQNILQLEFPGQSSITLPLILKNIDKTTEINLCQSKVCGDKVKCFDCGDEVAKWLNKCLNKTDLRLLRQVASDVRTNKEGESLSLTNQAQYLLINTASAKQLATAIPGFIENEDKLDNLIDRFRANFVIESDIPFCENMCQHINIGDMKLKCLGPCTRCQMICIDQHTGEKSAEPLKTLSALNKGKIRFGIYLLKTSPEEKTKIHLSEKVIFQ